MQKLIDYLKKNKISETEALERIQVQLKDPAKDFYVTIVSMTEQINSLIRSKSLDLDDPYQKSLLRLLESGDKVSKTLKNAQLDAYPQDDNEEQSIGDMLSKKKNGNK